MSVDDSRNTDERTILHFLGLWERRDVEGLLSCFTEDASYIDMPLPPRRGLDEIRAYLESIFSVFSVTIETLHIASRGQIVFTERVDHLRLDGDEGQYVALPVTGVMEMRDGKIAAWRDYLDLRTAEEGLGLSLRPVQTT